MNNNIRKFIVHKGSGKNPTMTMPRFIRTQRTPFSEQYSIMNERLQSIGTIDMHIGETIHATVVITPNMEELALELLVSLIKVELFEPLEVELGSLNVFKGVSDFTSLTEGDFYNRIKNEDDCNGHCDICRKPNCDVDETEVSKREADDKMLAIKDSRCD